jgi:hypothetical protein
VRLLIDGMPLITISATQYPSYSTYQQVTVNASAYANGATHRVKLHSQVDNRGVLTNFNVDDVMICALP